MNKLNRYIQNYLMLGFPLVMIYMIFGGYSLQHLMLFQILCINMLIWIVTLALYSISLLFLPSVRERTIMRLANIKERDEREVYITGQASRASYVSTLALMLCCLFFALFSVNYSHMNSSNNNTPKHSLNLSVNYSLLKNNADMRSVEEKNNTIFDSRDYAPSAASLIIIFIIWQLVIFKFHLRKNI